MAICIMNVFNQDAAASRMRPDSLSMKLPNGRRRDCVPRRDGRLYTTNATAVLGCSTPLSGRFQLRHTLGLFDAPGEHWTHDPADVDSAEHYRRCGDEFTHLLLKLDDGCLGPSSTGLATPDMARRLYYATDGRMRPLMNLVRVAGGWALETGGRISRQLLADAFELVGRTDDTLQAKANPFEMPTFGVEDLASAEETSRVWSKAHRLPCVSSRRRSGTSGDSFATSLDHASLGTTSRWTTGIERYAS
jgi:hypothetical protein